MKFVLTPGLKSGHPFLPAGYRYNSPPAHSLPPSAKWHFLPSCLYGIFEPAFL
ncbi:MULTISPECIES: hypothetical protein [unclassified Chitinophaga]|uniref:hypothetical protein n=1 Tax=unclassified Chitinophaga TaxID=2619133 RepID=UPI00301040E5